MRVLSRTYVLASIALLPFTGVLAHQSTRRSLSFRPRLKPDFSTDPLPILDSRDPHEVAHAFLHKLAYPSNGYIIRKDSYTDKKTGISHIYVRQVVDGIEVADGNINLNIRDGQVLSHGNSFFKGPVDSSLLSVPNWHQAVYCNEPLTTHHVHDHACGGALERLQSVASVYRINPATCLHDPRAAAFFFMQAAHPDPASLTSAFTSLEDKRHECTDLREEDISCSGWLISGFSNELEPIHARQVYVQTPGVDGATHLNLAWRLEVPMADNHYEAYVSVHDPTKIISVSDWVADAPAPDDDGWLSALERKVFGQLQDPLLSLDPAVLGSHPDTSPVVAGDFPKAGLYRVWRWGVNDPESGERTSEVAPAKTDASPLGWHSMPAANDPLQSHPDLDKDKILNYTTTVGNNVVAQENWAGDQEWKSKGRADGGPELVFDFPYGADPSESGWEKVQPQRYINMSITQHFHTANMYHDLLYHYGFDEASGNFQQYNFDKGGAENDAVIIKIQDGSGRNNANFVTPPDGKNGVCRMYVWVNSIPWRDGGLDAGILIHELSHGLSDRLTGGPRNSNCLRTREAGGMGEGWSDFIAITVRSTRTYQDYTIGAWAENANPGIRAFPYSTNIDVNPVLYDRLQRYEYWDPHAVGSVWAEILYVVSNKLIEKHGFADSLFPSDWAFYRVRGISGGKIIKAPKHGNTLMLQLVVNGMKLQPCNPTFIQARDAIIAADQTLTGGENKCTLWKAFASRGLGNDAKELTWVNQPSINGFKVPIECE